MGTEFIILICLLVVVVLLVMFVYIRDFDVNRRLGIFEKTIEDLSRQNHELNKILSEQNSKSANIEMSYELKAQVENEIKNKIASMQNSINKVEQITKEYHQKQNSVDNIFYDDIDYEKEVLTLHGIGKDKSKIAQILSISEEEVEMILKLNEDII